MIVLIHIVQNELIVYSLRFDHSALVSIYVTKCEFLSFNAQNDLCYMCDGRCLVLNFRRYGYFVFDSGLAIRMLFQS